MGASIITGYTGTRHITPEMDGAVYRGIIGDDSYILAEGDQCEGSMPSVNQFTVKSGVVSIQGRQIYITQETLAIDTCPTGYKRIDLVCARFEHDTTSLIDQASLIVIKGAEVSGGNDPIEPAHNEGVIKDGATVVDFVMYRLDLDGANVEITKEATVQSSLYISKETQDKWYAIIGETPNLDSILEYIERSQGKACVSLSANQNLTNALKIVNLDALSYLTGNFEQVSDGGIRCLKNGKVKVDGFATCVNVNSGDLTMLQAAIYSGGSWSSTGPVVRNVGGTNFTTVFVGVTFTVTAGQIIYMRAYNNNAARGQINSARMYIEYI